MNRHNVINETTKSLNKWCCLGWEEHPRGRPPGGAGGRQGGQHPHPQGRKINTFEIHIIYLCNYMFITGLIDIPHRQNKTSKNYFLNT